MSGIASIVIFAGWPSFTLGMFVSSTSTSAWMIDMSASVSSTVPALFIVPMTAVSPSWMMRFVTMPSIGDSIRTLLRSYCALSSVAFSCAMRRLCAAAVFSRSASEDSAPSRRSPPCRADRACELLFPEVLLAFESLSQQLELRLPVSIDCCICAERHLVGLQATRLPDRRALQRLGIDLQQELSLPDAVAFVHHQVDHAPDRIRADVDGSLRLNLAGSGDDGLEIARLDQFGGEPSRLCRAENTDWHRRRRRPRARPRS